MKPKKLLIFSQNFSPSSFADAVRMNAVVQYFVSQGAHITLYTTTKEAVYFKEKFAAVRIFRLGRPFNTDRAVTRLLKEVLLGLQLFLSLIFGKKHDLFLFTSPPFISCILASFAVIIRKGRLIFDVRDIYPDIYVQQNLISEGGIINKFLGKIEQFIYNKSYAVLTVTGKLVSLLQERTKARVFLYRNGYTDAFNVSQCKFTDFTIVFHGNLGRFQNIELLIDIAMDLSKLHPEIKVKVIGSGPKAKLLERIDIPNLEYCGRLSNENTAEIVKKCHLGISLRDDSQISKDAFPVKLFEYIGAGLPIIVSPICEGGMVIEKIGAGYTMPNDKTTILNRIIALKQDRLYYNSVVEQIIRQRERYSRALITKTVFEEILYS